MTNSVTGNLDVDIQHEKVGIIWQIYQVAIGYDKPGNMSVQLLVNGVPYSSQVLIKSGQAASGTPYCVIGRGDILTVHMLGGPVSSNVQVTYYYDELREDQGN